MANDPYSAIVTQEYQMLRNEILARIDSSNKFPAWASVITGGMVAAAWYKINPNSLSLGACSIFCFALPAMLSAIYWVIIMNCVELQRLRDYLGWIEYKLALVTEASNGLLNELRNGAEEFVKPFHAPTKIASLLAPAGWHSWLQRDRKPRLGTFIKYSFFVPVSSSIIGVIYILYKWDHLSYCFRTHGSTGSAESISCRLGELFWKYVASFPLFASCPAVVDVAICIFIFWLLMSFPYAYFLHRECDRQLGRSYKGIRPNSPLEEIHSRYRVPRISVFGK
jgi:hypothetical protein